MFSYVSSIFPITRVQYKKISISASIHTYALHQAAKLWSPEFINYCEETICTHCGKRVNDRFVAVVDIVCCNTKLISSPLIAQQMKLEPDILVHSASAFFYNPLENLNIELTLVVMRCP